VKLRLLSMFILIAVLILSATVVSAHGPGNNPASLGDAGWMCVNVPGLGVHCFAPGAFKASASVPVKVFDTDNPDAEHAKYLGTEILILDDLYHGQPCATDSGDEYHFLPADESPFLVDYRACHHYSN
jgi:hypothetical protein